MYPLFQSISGTIPRSVEIELQGDLVGTACPGDVLSVTGIVQVLYGYRLMRYLEFMLQNMINKFNVTVCELFRFD